MSTTADHPTDTTGGDPTVPRRRIPAGLAVAGGALAMCAVGSSVAVSAHLADAPLLTAQAVRYAAACALLSAMAAIARIRVPRPQGREWLWLLGVVVTGLLLFNVALVEGGRHAEPAVLGVAVACVPLVFALAGPLLERRRPRTAVLVAAAVVTAGAVLVEGTGRTDAVGLAWAVVVFGGEAAFTLLAVPVLRRRGPWTVSVHTTWPAAVAFGVTGLVVEGPDAVTRLSPGDLAAVAHLAVMVTAMAFVLWYTAVARLGSARAGLLTGIAPAAAAGVGVALGGGVPGATVWVGIALVAVGLAIGLRSGTGD